MGNSKREIIVVVLLMLFLGLVFTFPLIMHFTEGIPFGHISDGDTPFLKIGDHLQLYYWFWLLKDNLFGESTLFSNPYEFNMGDRQVSLGYHMFPFSLLFLILTPFGDVFAYNATILLSFILSGLFMYILVKFLTASRTASLISAFVFAFAPFRLAQMYAAHLNGFIFFFYPLIIYLLEVSIRRASIIHSFLAGLAIFSLSLMEPHLTYYIFLLLGIYIPLRLLTSFILSQDKVDGVLNESYLLKSESESCLMDLIGVICIGIILSLFHQMVITRESSIPFVNIANKHLLYSLLIYPLFLVSLWVFFSSLYSLFYRLKLSRALKADQLTYLPLILLLIYPIQYIFNIPHLGKVLLLLSLGGIFVLKLFLIVRFREGFLRYDIGQLRRIMITILPIVLFMVISAAYILYKKHSIFDTSIVQGGRHISMVYTFSPRVSDVFVTVNSMAERFIYLGVIPLFLYFFILFRLISRPDSSFVGQRGSIPIISFFTLSMLFCYLLSIGPSLTKSFPLYLFLYKYFPFFNYPRASGRMMIIVFLILSVLVGYSVKELQTWSKKINRKWFFTSVPILMAIMILVDYHTFKPIAITKISKKNKVYEYIRDNIGDGLLLELPLWPGDSHQSSLYEYNTTLDRARRVNGYSPAVSKEYIDTIFWPLYSLNLGHIDNDQYKLLKRLGIEYITIHDNIDVFTKKAGAFPPLFSVRRLMDSPFIDFMENDMDVYLFRVRDKSYLATLDSKTTSTRHVISRIYDAERLQYNTGKIIFDSRIGKQVIWGTADNDSVGHLTYGPYVTYPKGRYLAYFRLKVNNNREESPVVRIEVTSPHHGKELVLAERDIRSSDFDGEGVYQDFYIYFDVDSPKKLEFRTFFYKRKDIWIEKVVTSFLDQKEPAQYYEAEHLLGDTGIIKEDKLASNNRCILGVANQHRPGYLIYGPYRKYPSGQYRALFRIKVDSSGVVDRKKEISSIEIASDSGNKVLAGYSLSIGDFKGSDYSMVPLDFKLNRMDELDFRVKFDGIVDICVDRVEVINR